MIITFNMICVQDSFWSQSTVGVISRARHNIIAVVPCYLHKRRHFQLITELDGCVTNTVCRCTRPYQGIVLATHYSLPSFVVGGWVKFHK